MATDAVNGLREYSQCCYSCRLRHRLVAASLILVPVNSCMSRATRSQQCSPTWAWSRAQTALRGQWTSPVAEEQTGATHCRMPEVVTWCRCWRASRRQRGFDGFGGDATRGRRGQGPCRGRRCPRRLRCLQRHRWRCRRRMMMIRTMWIQTIRWIERRHRWFLKKRRFRW